MTNSRRKGKDGELELAKWFRKRGVRAARGRQFHGRDDAPDVVVDLPGFHIECKRCEQLRLWPALEQATTDAGPHLVPVIFHRASRRPWVAILPAEQFLRLMLALGAIVKPDD